MFAGIHGQPWRTHGCPWTSLWSLRVGSYVRGAHWDLSFAVRNYDPHGHEPVNHCLYYARPHVYARSFCVHFYSYFSLSLSLSLNTGSNNSSSSRSSRQGVQGLHPWLPVSPHFLAVKGRPKQNILWRCEQNSIRFSDIGLLQCMRHLSFYSVFMYRSVRRRRRR